MKQFKINFTTDVGNPDYIILQEIDEESAKKKADKFLSFLKNKKFDVEEVLYTEISLNVTKLKCE
jgi:hypothetical protein